MKKMEIKNAVLRKDMLLDMKRPKIFILLLGINLLVFALLLFAVIPVVTSAFDGTTEALNPRFMIGFFSFLLWTIEIAVIFLVPALTAGAVSIEKERQTLEVLLTTRMTTWQIVSGKYFSTVFLVVLLILSTLPALCSMFLYGGINILQMLILLCVLISTVVYIASFGIFFSALIKNTILSVILTYISVFAVLSLTFMFTVIGMAVMLILDEMLCNYIFETFGKSVSDVISGDLFITILYFNPVVTLFDAISQTFGYTFFDLADPMYGIKDMELFVHFTEKNLLLRWFPLFSVALQTLVSFLLLRAAAFFLKPVKKKAKKQKVRGAKADGERPSNITVY